jgi:hypothetical protein
VTAGDPKAVIYVYLFLHHGQQQHSTSHGRKSRRGMFSFPSAEIVKVAHAPAGSSLASGQLRSLQVRFFRPRTRLIIEESYPNLKYLSIVVLADFGADVIRIDRPGSKEDSDVTSRSASPCYPEIEGMYV